MVRPRPVVEKLTRTNQHDHSRRGMLRLDMNEGVPGLPEEFVRGVLDSVDAEYLATYPEYAPLELAIAAHDGVDRSMVVLSNGSDAAIKYTFEAFVSAGDRVLITDPTFAMYPVYCTMFGAEQIAVPYADDLSFPLDAFKRELERGDVRVAVVVNPNNPTGTAVDLETLREIAALAAEHDTLLLVDEAYHYFHPVTAVPLLAEFGNVIVTRTFSKLCGLACLRMGYALAPAPIAGALRNVKPTYDVNGLGALFALRLLEQPELMTDLIAEASAGKKLLVERLESTGIGFRAGEANFILIDCGENVLDVVAELAERGVLVSGGFRQPFLERYARVTVGDRASVEAFWGVFSAVWEG